MDLKVAFLLAASLFQLMLVSCQEESVAYRQQNRNNGYGNQNGGNGNQNGGYETQSGNVNRGSGGGNWRSFCPACHLFERRLRDEYTKITQNGESVSSTCQKDMEECEWENMKKSSYKVEDMNMHDCWNQLKILYKMEGVVQ